MVFADKWLFPFVTVRLAEANRTYHHGQAVGERREDGAGSSGRDHEVDLWQELRQWNEADRSHAVPIDIGGQVLRFRRHDRGEAGRRDRGGERGQRCAVIHCGSHRDECAGCSSSEIGSAVRAELCSLTQGWMVIRSSAGCSVGDRSASG
jgi:hypothetical protein